MSHPLYHAETCVKLWGGKTEDYLPIHCHLDRYKRAFADFRHRLMTHHSEGIFDVEERFGISIKNSDGKDVPVRTICEVHIKQDCGGRIPTLADWLREIKPAGWMARTYLIVKGETSLKSTLSSATGKTTASPTVPT